MLLGEFTINLATQLNEGQALKHENSTFINTLKVPTLICYDVRVTSLEQTDSEMIKKQSEPKSLPQHGKDEPIKPCNGFALVKPVAGSVSPFFSSS